MFTAYCNGELFYVSGTPSDEFKLSSPKLTKETNKTDIFEFTLPPINIAYDNIECLESWIEVYRDDELWFEGYAMNEKTNFWKEKTISCEGSLALLTRTMQPNMAKIFGTIRQYLDYILEVHNSKITNEKEKFYIGSVTVEDPDFSHDYRVLNYDSTYNYLMEIVNNYGGFIHITRNGEGQRLLNYYKDHFTTSSQQIVFGKNLMDHTKNYDRTELATVIIPLGMTKTEAQKKIDEENKKDVVDDDKTSKKTIEDIAKEVAQQKYGFTIEEVKENIYTKYTFKDSKKYLDKEAQYAEKEAELKEKLAELNQKWSAAKRYSERDQIQKQIDSVNKQIANNDANKAKLAEDRAKAMDFNQLWDLRNEHVIQVAIECNQGKWGKDQPHVEQNLAEKGYNIEEINKLRETVGNGSTGPDDDVGIILTDTEEELEGEMRITIEPVNAGKPYLVSEAAKTYGWIEKVVVFEDVYYPEALKARGEEYLKNMQFDNMTLEVSALDLSYMNAKEA